MDDKAEWLAQRRTGIGSSDAPIIAGVSRWKSAFALWAEKVGLADLDAQEGEWLEWGLRLEPVIAAKYAEETGRALVDRGRFVIQRHASLSWCLATIDREIPGPPLGVLEVKTAASWKAEDWQDEPPLAYQIQLQHQLAVTGASWGSLAVLIGGQRFRWCDVARNDRFIEVLLEREYAFWRRVETGDPPSPDANEATRDLLVRLYPEQTPGEVVALPGAAMDWDAQREEAIEQLKQWEAKKREAENQLKGALGSAERGIAPNGVAYTWTTSERKGYTVAATTVRTLRRRKEIEDDRYRQLVSHPVDALPAEGRHDPKPLGSDEAADRAGAAAALDAGSGHAGRPDLHRQDAGIDGM